MVRPELRYAYPLPGGGSEYTFGEFVWTVTWAPATGWQITAEAWDDGADVPVRVMADGFATAAVAELALLTNHPPLYLPATGTPVPEDPRHEAVVDTKTETGCLADRALVLACRPTARVESRTNPWTCRSECRIVCTPERDAQADLSGWCTSEDRAWRAACLKHNPRRSRRM